MQGSNLPMLDNGDNMKEMSTVIQTLTEMSTITDFLYTFH